MGSIVQATQRGGTGVHTVRAQCVRTRPGRCRSLHAAHSPHGPRECTSGGAAAILSFPVGPDRRREVAWFMRRLGQKRNAPTPTHCLWIKRGKLRSQSPGTRHGAKVLLHYFLSDSRSMFKNFFMCRVDVMDGAVSSWLASGILWTALRCTIWISPDERIEVQQTVHEGSLLHPGNVKSDLMNIENSAAKSQQ